MGSGLQRTVLTHSRHRVKASSPIAIHQLSLIGARVGLAGALGVLGVLVQVYGLFAIMDSLWSLFRSDFPSSS